MTEDEAKTKRCPVGAGRLALYQDARAKLDVQKGLRVQLFTSDCIGSGCMAWRWDMTATEWMARPGERSIPTAWTISDEHGHCGLAGDIR